MKKYLYGVVSILIVGVGICLIVGKEDVIEYRYDGLEILFFGDLIYDRTVAKDLPLTGDIQNHFSYWDTETIGTGDEVIRNISSRMDFVGLNLETPLGKETIYGTGGEVKVINECQKTGKIVAFCSDEGILPELKLLGFNIVGIANNHTMDGGVSGHLSTLKSLKKYGMPYVGTVRHGPYYSDTYIYKGEKRGHKYARHGFDVIVYKGIRRKEYCKQLNRHKKKGYVNMVSIHRGKEYQKKHSQKQEDLAHYLIDCGADILIGHHPHVVQDVGWYKGKPIIYSLGNFLFDQGFSEETKRGGYAYIRYPWTGDVQLITGSINAFSKKNK